MTGRGHIGCAGAIGLLAGLGVYALRADVLAGAAVCAGALATARAPDWLEVRLIGRLRMIPHRTLTHWAVLWASALACALWCAWSAASLPLWLLVGFALGGLIHVAGDWLTPAGVPLLHPLHRHSARLIRGPFQETLLVTALWGLVLGVLTVGQAWALEALPARKLGEIIDNDPQRCRASGQCGWWWGHIDPLEEQRKREAVQALQGEQPPPSPSRLAPESPECQASKTWTEECGFVDPRGDFGFQAKQRDALLNAAVMNPRDSWVVEQFQRYQQWVNNQAILLTQMWQWNMQQNPELNALVANPVSRIGLRFASQVDADRAEGTWAVLREQGAFFVWWTRNDCTYCHQSADLVHRIGERSGLMVWDASLEEQCIPGFEAACKTAPETLGPAQRLQVTVVPTLFLYLPETDSWIRVSTGVETVDTVLSRARTFFQSVRAAFVKGMTPGADGRPPVDFSDQTFDAAALMRVAYAKGLAAGVPPAPTKE